jgi:hypothetical protein
VDQIVSFLQLISAFDALGWFGDLRFINTAQWALVVGCWWVIIGAGLLGPLFVGYVFLTHLDKVKKANGNKLPGLVWLISTLPAVVSGICDVAFNVGWGTIIFMDLPRELTLSQRMSRYWKGPDDWRREVVVWAKVNSLIDSFDFRGQHIG